MAFPSLRVLNSSHTQLGNGDSWKAPFHRLWKTEAWLWKRSLVSFGFLDVNDAEQGGIVCDTLFWLQEQLAARLRKPSKLALAQEILGGECGGSMVEGCFTLKLFFVSTGVQVNAADSLQIGCFTIYLLFKTKVRHRETFSQQKICSETISTS